MSEAWRAPAGRGRIRSVRSRLRAMVALIVVGALGWSPSSGWADIRLPKIFGDSMVLQRQSEVHLYGMALPNESLVLTIAGSGIENRELKTVCDSQGEFSLKFSPPPVGGPYELTLTGAASKVVIRDVLVGDVWLCVGQSNLEWPIEKSAEAERPVAAVERPHLRLLTVPRASSQQPLTDFTGLVSWSRSTPQTAPAFSAVGWHLGSYLEQDLQVPVGVIQASWGGTRAEAWIASAALAAEPELGPLLTQAELLGEAVKQQDRLGGLYHAMVAPLNRFPIKGVVWYQGEANVGRGQQYRTLLPTLIRDWRHQRQDPHLPFLIVQLAPFRYKNHPPQALPELWDAQLLTWKSIPRTGLVVTTDLGNPEDVHPVQKQEVGRRLALWALAEVYRGQRLRIPIDEDATALPDPASPPTAGKANVAGAKEVGANELESNEAGTNAAGDGGKAAGTQAAGTQAAGDTPSSGGLYSGPLFRAASVSGGVIEVTFYAGQGLQPSDGQPLRGFAIAGQDQVFHPAEARIVDEKVLVACPEVLEPVAVRYSWTDTPDGNLSNLLGLPAFPFRSDTFPLLSRDKHY